MLEVSSSWSFVLTIPNRFSIGDISRLWHGQSGIKFISHCQYHCLVTSGMWHGALSCYRISVLAATKQLSRSLFKILRYTLLFTVWHFGRMTRSVKPPYANAPHTMRYGGCFTVVTVRRGSQGDPWRGCHTFIPVFTGAEGGFICPKYLLSSSSSPPLPFTFPTWSGVGTLV